MKKVSALERFSVVGEKVTYLPQVQLLEPTAGQVVSEHVPYLYAEVAENWADSLEFVF